MNYFSHSYYQGDDYARGDYQYGESDVANATRITENFNYYLDGSTMLITGIDIRTEINAYDAQARKDFDHYYVYKDEDATFADERKEKFYYFDPDVQHYRLEYSTEKAVFTSSHGDEYTEIFTYTYYYSGLRNSGIDDEDIFTTRYGVGTVTYIDSDGQMYTDNAYQNHSFTEAGNSSYEEIINVGTCVDGLITYLSIKVEQESRNGDATTNEVEAYDMNSDGIIEETSEWNYRQQ